jgi:hypothetical protein
LRGNATTPFKTFSIGPIIGDGPAARHLSLNLGAIGAVDPRLLRFALLRQTLDII